MATRYINKPGGALVHLADGQVKHLAYGDKLPAKDDLSDAQADQVDRISDTKERRSSPEAERIRDAHRSAVDAELGQPNSTSSPIPANYGELDEDGAIALMRALEAYPEAQAKLVIHERVNDDREKVIDAASDEAIESADAYTEQLGESAEVDVLEARFGTGPSGADDNEGEEVQTASVSPDPAAATAERGQGGRQGPGVREGGAGGAGGGSQQATTTPPPNAKSDKD